MPFVVENDNYTLQTSQNHSTHLYHNGIHPVTVDDKGHSHSSDCGMRINGINNEDTIRADRKDSRKKDVPPSTINRELSFAPAPDVRGTEGQEICGDIPDFRMTPEDRFVGQNFLEHKDFERLLASLPQHGTR